MNNEYMTAKIQRFDRKRDKVPYFQEFKVLKKDIEGMSVLDLIKYIHDNMDCTLAYRNVKCYIGVCTACLMNIDGKNLRACSTLVSDKDIIIGPAKKNGPVVRDLVTDFGIMRHKEAIDEQVEQR